ncbi:hypothetical protein PROFUN_14555 [Planoprotostelium fungivorum]|uniref:Uncharacterized protein n=1 Tax=Planoprotostelium fungivorum TaxID=1890364 RepID=A0A2P6MZK5_9EUKA|nr:hypothetical protein PROFUN_14555 [Planoprotostelium fungivorum]
MGSICDHKCIVYGSSDSSAEQYCLSTPSIRAKSLLLFSFLVLSEHNASFYNVKRPKCDLENVAYNSCLLATTLNRCKEQNQEKNSAGCRELRRCHR